MTETPFGWKAFGDSGLSWPAAAAVLVLVALLAWRSAVLRNALAAQ